MISFPFHILQDHDKPLYGEPCNNCGLCCRVQACKVSEIFLKSSQAPCIALEYHDGKLLCGMLIRPAHYLGITFPDATAETASQYLIPQFRLLIGAGDGCSMPDEVLAVKLKVGETA